MDIPDEPTVISPTETVPDRDYIIDVGPQGTFNNSGNYQTIPKDIDDMFVAFEAAGVRKIAIYFHGGLVNETSGMESARQIYAPIKAAGCAPVCFVWETGLMETISTNLSKISETKLYNKLLKLLLKKVIEKLGFDSPLGRGTPAPVPEDEQVEAELRKPVPFAEYNRSTPEAFSRSAVNVRNLEANTQDLEALLNGEISREVMTDSEFMTIIANSKVSVVTGQQALMARGPISLFDFIAHAAKIAYRVITRFIAHRDHDLYPTIVEEILREFYIAELGAWVWQMMKEKAGGMWQSNESRNGLDRYAGRYFLDRLADFKARYPETTISLVGHSAGSIAICNLLKYIDALLHRFSYDHIIFMAPACRIELFNAEMLQHRERYKDIRIFTMTNDNECKDNMVPFFYTHSLLYLISGILEDEGQSPDGDAYILGLQRHIAFLMPYNISDLGPLHEYLYKLDRVSFSVCDSPTLGLDTTALSHGAFHNDPATVTSMTYFLSN